MSSVNLLITIDLADLADFEFRENPNVLSVMVSEWNDKEYQIKIVKPQKL